jgi:hypothetical protein
VITKEQAITLSTVHLPDQTQADKCYVLRRSGRTKTWVTEPTYYRMPYKYGMYEYGYVVAPEMAHGDRRPLRHKGGWVDGETCYVQAECPACHGARS